MPGTSPVPSGMLRSASAPVVRRASPPAAMALGPSATATAQSRPAWLPEDCSAFQRTAASAAEREPVQSHQNSARALVGWFTEHMPAAYFREVSKPSGIAHLRSLKASADDVLVQQSQVTADLGNGVTELSFLRRADIVNTAATLTQLLEKLPEEIRDQLHRVKLFTSRDDRLQIFAFTYGPVQAVSGSLVEYLAGFDTNLDADGGTDLPIKLRFPNPENIHHFANLRHKQCRLSAGALDNEHRSIFVERRGYTEEVSHKLDKFKFYCAFTGWEPHALATAAAAKVADDGFALRAFHLDLVTGTTPDAHDASLDKGRSSMLHMEAISPVDLRGEVSSLASWKSAQNLRWRLQTMLIKERLGNTTADLEDGFLDTALAA